MDDQSILIPKTDLEQLLDLMIKELTIEILYNNDSTKFWSDSMEHIFGSSLVSFRESITEFKASVDENKDMMNYFSALCFRIFSKPYTLPVLADFSKGFNTTSTDSVFDGVYKYNMQDLSPVEKLLLFFTVHRNEITLILQQQKELNKAPTPKTRKRQ